MMQGSPLIPSRVSYISIEMLVGSAKEDHIFYTDKAFGANPVKMIAPALGMGILIVKYTSAAGAESTVLFPLDKVLRVEFKELANPRGAILVD